MDIVYTVDARGQIAPLPLVELKKAIDGADTGQAVELISDDKSIAADVERFASGAGHLIVSSKEEGCDLHFVLTRGG